jgi:hypothetical protein
VNKIKGFLRDLSFLYCDAVSNPFYEMGSTIVSAKFKEKLAQLLALFH